MLKRTFLARMKCCDRNKKVPLEGFSYERWARQDSDLRPSDYESPGRPNRATPNSLELYRSAAG